MNKSDSIAALATALATAQGEIENADKTSVNPAFKTGNSSGSKYADLAEVINTVRPVFSKHGLAFTQMPSFESGICHVETLLMHKSGEWVSSICSAPVSKQDAQGVGSAITYCRRYSLAAVAGIAQEDDDGNNAVGNHKPNVPTKPTTPKPTAEATTTITTAQIDKIKDLLLAIAGDSLPAMDALLYEQSKYTPASGGERFLTLETLPKASGKYAGSVIGRLEKLVAVTK